MAAEALRLVVVVAALWTGGGGIESVPRMGTAATEPLGTVGGFPRTFWAVDFNFAFGTHTSFDDGGENYVRLFLSTGKFVCCKRIPDNKNGQAPKHLAVFF